MKLELASDGFWNTKYSGVTSCSDLATVRRYVESDA